MFKLMLTRYLLRLLRVPLILFLALLATSCATRGPVINEGCDWALPIYISKQDVLTDSTARQILAHDLTGQEICRWKPRKST